MHREWSFALIHFKPLVSITLWKKQESIWFSDISRRDKKRLTAWNRGKSFLQKYDPVFKKIWNCSFTLFWPVLSHFYQRFSDIFMGIKRNYWDETMHKKWRNHQLKTSFIVQRNGTMENFIFGAVLIYNFSGTFKFMLHWYNFGPKDWGRLNYTLRILVSGALTF